MRVVDLGWVGDIDDETMKLFKTTLTLNFGWVRICVYNFFISGPKSTNFLFNAAGIACNDVCFLFSIYRSVLEIFVVKVKSCPKSR